MGIIEIGLILLLPAVSLAFNPNTNSVFALNKLVVLRVVTIVVSAFYLVGFLKKKELRILQTPLNYPVLIFLMVNFIATLTSIHPWLSLKGEYKSFLGLSTILNFIILYFLMVMNLKKENLELSLYLLIFTSGLIAGYGLGQFLSVDPIKTWSPSPQIRPFSSLGNSNYLGGYLAATISLTIIFILARPILRILIPLLVSLSLQYVVLLLTLNRGAWLGLLGSLLFLGFLLKREVSKRMLLGLGLTLFLLTFLVSLVLIPSKNESDLWLVKRALSSLDLKEGTTIQRLLLWRSTLRAIGTRPFIGWGLESFQSVIPSFLDPEIWHHLDRNIYFTKAHNEYLDIGLSTGLLGGGVYLWLVFTFFWLGFRSLKDGVEKRSLIIGLMATMVALLIQNIFSFSVITTSLLFWMLLGMMIVLTDSGSRIEIRIKLRSVYRWAIYSTLLLLVLILLNTGRFYLADIYFKKSVRLESEERWEEAILYCQKALSLNKEEAYYQKLGELYRKRGEKEQAKEPFLEESLRALERAISINPWDAFTYSELGKVYEDYSLLEKGKIDKAVEMFKKASSLDPTRISFRLNLARVYKRKGMEEAFQEYQEIIKMDPFCGEARLGLAKIFLLKGRYQEARSQYEEVIRVEPEGKLANIARWNLERLKGLE